MEKWSIHDSRFTFLGVYLTQFHKLKLVQATNDKVILDILDQYNKPHFYVKKKSVLISRFFEIVKGVIKDLNELKKGEKFNCILMEIIRKIYFMFFNHLDEMIDHKKFSLKPEFVCLLYEELGKVKKYKKGITFLISESYKINYDFVDNYTYRRMIEKIVKSAKSKLLNRLIEFIEPTIQEYFEKNSLEEMNLEDLFTKLEKKESDFKNEEFRFKEVYEILKVDTVIKEITNMIYKDNDSDFIERIEHVCNNVIGCFEKMNSNLLHCQTVYFQQLSIFFRSQNVERCQIALSSIANILSFKLNKSDFAKLIQKKFGKIKSDFRKQISDLISSEFELKEKFNRIQERHKKSTRILRAAILSIIFSNRIKKIIYSRRLRRKKEDKHTRSLPKIINIKADVDFDEIFSRRPVKISYNLLKKREMNNILKSKNINEA